MARYWSRICGVGAVAARLEHSAARSRKRAARCKAFIGILTVVGCTFIAPGNVDRGRRNTVELWERTLDGVAVDVRRFLSNSIARNVWVPLLLGVHHKTAGRGCRAGKQQAPQWRQGTGSRWWTRQQRDRSFTDPVRFMRKALVRCQQDGIESLAAALTQRPAEVHGWPMTKKQQADAPSNLPQRRLRRLQREFGSPRTNVGSLFFFRGPPWCPQEKLELAAYWQVFSCFPSLTMAMQRWPGPRIK
jgi:hypothetical protein